MMAHVRGAHHEKQVTYICKLCMGHFPTVRGLNGHFNIHHKRESTDASAYTRIYMGTYTLIPFCKECGYAHFKLFSSELGCWCADRRPTPGTAHEYDALYDSPITEIKGLVHTRKRVISDDYVCEKVGVAFTKKKTTASTSKTVPKVVVKKLKTGEAYSVVPKYGPTPRQCRAKRDN